MANNDYKLDISDYVAIKRNRGEQQTQQPIQNMVDVSTTDNTVNNPTDQPTLEQLKKLLNIDDNKKIEVEDLEEKLVKYNEVDSNVGNQLYNVMVDESVADVSDRIEAIMNSTEIRAKSFIPPIKRQKIRYELVPKYIDINKKQIEINTIKDFNPMSIVDMQAPKDPQVRARELDEYKYKLQVCLDILSYSNSDINKNINKYEQYKLIHKGTPDLIKKADNHIASLKALKIRNVEIRNSIKNIVIPEIRLYNPSSPRKILKMELEKQLELVNEFPLSLGLIPFPDRETIITAIKKDPQSIICIPSPDPQLQQLAVEVGGPEMIRFIKASEYDSRKDRPTPWTKDPKAIAMACKQDWRIIGYLIKQQQTEEIQKIAILKNPNAIKYIEAPTVDVQKLVFKENPKLIKYIRTPDPKIKKFAEKHNIVFQIEQFKKENFKVDVDNEKYQQIKKRVEMEIKEISIPHLLSNLMMPLSGETVKYKTRSFKPKNDLVQAEDLITNQYISKYISEYRKAFLGEYFKSKKEMPTEFLPIRVSYLFSFKNQSNQQCPAYYIRVIDVRNYLLTNDGFTERIPTDNAEQKARFIADFYKNKKNLTSIQAVEKTIKSLESSLSYTEALNAMPQFIYDEPTGDALVRKIQNMHGNTGAVVYIYNQSKKQLHTYARMVFAGKGHSANLQKSNKRSYITSQSEFAIPINWLQSQLEKSKKQFDSVIYRYFFKAVKSGRLPGSFQNYCISKEVMKEIQTFNEMFELKRSYKQRKKQAIIDKKAEIDAQTHNIDPNKVKQVLRSWFAEDLKWNDNVTLFKLPKLKIEDPRIGPLKRGVFNFQKVWDQAGDTLKEKINTFNKIFKINSKMIPKQSIINLYNALSKTKDWSAEMIASLMNQFGFENIATPVQPISTPSTSSDKTSMDSEIQEFKRLYDLNTQIRLDDVKLGELKRLGKKYPDVYKELERNAYKANLKQSKNIHERLSSLMTTSNVKMLSQYIKKKLSLNQTSKIQYNKITSILSTHVNNIIKQSEQPKKKDQKKKLLLDETNKQYEYNTIDKTLTILNLEYSYRDVFNIYSKFKNKTIDITNQSKKNLQKYFNEWFILYLQSVIRKYKKYIDSATIIRFSTLQKKDRYLQYNIQFKIQSEINKQIVNKNNRIRKIVYKIVKKISKKSINIDSIQYNLNRYLKLNSKKFRNIEI